MGDMDRLSSFRLCSFPTRSRFEGDVAWSSGCTPRRFFHSGTAGETSQFWPATVSGHPHPVIDPMRILVVEDEPDLCRLVVQALRENGYAVDDAADGHDGLYKATTWNTTPLFWT